MFATSRKTRTASAVTSGPIPSPGRTTIFNFIIFRSAATCRSFCLLLVIESGDKSPHSKLRSYRRRPLWLFSCDHRLMRQDGLGRNQRDQILIVNSLLAIGHFGKAL